MEYDDYVVEERLQKDFSIYHRQRKKNGNVYSKKLREFVNTILNEAKTFVNDNGLQHVVTTNIQPRGIDVLLTAHAHTRTQSNFEL